MRWDVLACMLLAAALFVPRTPSTAPSKPATAALRPESDEQAASNAGSFAAFDIFVDAGDSPLAAYQLEFKSNTGGVRIVGVEGGESEAFKDAPFYDPQAMQGERVIIGAFCTLPREGLPTGRTRVARIHVMLPAGAAPNLAAELQTAGTVGGSKVDARASWSAAGAAGSGNSDGIDQDGEREGSRQKGGGR